MSNRVCPQCKRLQTFSIKDWKLVSGIPDILCSKECVLDFIRQERTEPILRGRGFKGVCGPADEVYSDKLQMFFRSEYERHVAEWFRDNGIKFMYEFVSFRVKKKAWWTPDFYLPDHFLIIEVKGPWAVSAKSKMTSFLDLYPDIPLLVIPWTLHKEFYV